jgi:hypothetical protein
MPNISRRNIFKACLAGAAVAPLTFVGATQTAASKANAKRIWVTVLI